MSRFLLSTRAGRWHISIHGDRTIDGVWCGREQLTHASEPFCTGLSSGLVGVFHLLCLLSRDSHGDTGKLNHEETVRGPEIAIFPEKSEILLLILVKILKKSDSTHSSSKGAVNAYFLTGSFSKKTWLFEAVVLVG